MKLTIIGGGSVRTPQLIPTLVRRAEKLSLDELWLMDTDAEKLQIIGGLCQQLAENARFRVILTTNAREALTNAQHIITSIRPGLERGRALDERICFNHGILGQETTGAAGFAMAMRSIPAILDYARLAAEVSAPNAWMYNFTNPAGLVAQALHYAGIQCVVGICDSANGAQHAVSRYMDVPLARVRHTVYGLNHLSWTRSTTVDGEEVLPALLRDDAFVNSTHMPMFARGLRLWQGAFLNEYLHYYYHRDEALAALLAKRETRGEEVMRLTNELLKKLRTVAENERLAVYHDVMGRRSATYMAHARNGVPREPRISEDDEGYTGVALGCMQAMATNTTHYTGLNVPNNDTIAGLREDDVVEVSCIIENGQISPVAVSDIPDHQFALMLVVKQYERMAARAILACSREGAVEALAIHPLIGSYPLAQTLVNEFLAAHQDLIGTWN